MCTVSMIGDHFSDKWKQPDYTDLFKKINENQYQSPFPAVTRQEHDALKIQVEQLKKEVEEMTLLLKRAIEYDKKNNEPQCEIEEKIRLLKEVAKMVGVDLEAILKTNSYDALGRD